MTVRRSELEPRGSIVSPYRCSAKDFSPGDVTLVTGWSRKGSYPPSFVHTRICPGTELGSSKMSLYQTAIELRPRMSLAPALLAVRTHRVADALLVFALVILPMVVMIALLFLLGSADQTTAVAGVVDGTGMLILAP